MRIWQQVLTWSSLFFTFFYNQLVAVAGLNFSLCLEALPRQRRPTFFKHGAKWDGETGRVGRGEKRRRPSEFCMSSGDSKQVVSLASQSIWPQFRHERWPVSGVNKALIFFPSIRQTRNGRGTTSLWGLTASAANNLSATGRSGVKVATRPCELFMAQVKLCHTLHTVTPDMKSNLLSFIWMSWKHWG